MSDDVVQRLFDKMDDLKDQLGELSKKVVELETTLKEREKHQISNKGAVAWVVTTVIALYGAFRH